MPTLVAMTAGSRQAISAYKTALESFPNASLLLAGLVLNLGLVGDSQQADHYLARLRQVDAAGLTTFNGDGLDDPSAPADGGFQGITCTPR